MSNYERIKQQTERAGTRQQQLFRMSEERSAKLKLKRKKCATTGHGGQEVEVRPQPSYALNVRQDFTGSWFDKIELTSAEQIWKQVLSSVRPDLSGVDWGAVPSLPDANLKISRKEEMIDAEVFKVGDMNFEWVPLPPALAIDNAEKPGVPEVDANRQNIEHIEKPFADTLPENIQQRKSPMLLTKQFGNPVCSEDSRRNTKGQPTPQTGSTRNVMMPSSSQKSTKNVTKPRTLLKSSSKNVKEPQILHKVSSKNAKEPQKSQRSSTKHTKEQKPSVSLWATVTSLKSNKIMENHKEAENPRPNDVLMVEAAKEETSEGRSREHEIRKSAEKSAGATSSMDNCPICLMQFPKQFSQLDMDSHLAQCLSETTVDVVW